MVNEHPFGAQHLLFKLKKIALLYSLFFPLSSPSSLPCTLSPRAPSNFLTGRSAAALTSLLFFLLSSSSPLLLFYPPSFPVQAQ